MNIEHIPNLSEGEHPLGSTCFLPIIPNPILRQGAESPAGAEGKEMDAWVRSKEVRISQPSATPIFSEEKTREFWDELSHKKENFAGVRVTDLSL